MCTASYCKRTKVMLTFYYSHHVCQLLRCISFIHNICKANIHTFTFMDCVHQCIQDRIDYIHCICDWTIPMCSYHQSQNYDSYYGKWIRITMQTKEKLTCQGISLRYATWVHFEYNWYYTVLYNMIRDDDTADTDLPCCSMTQLNDIQRVPMVLSTFWSASDSAGSTLPPNLPIFNSASSHTGMECGVAYKSTLPGVTWSKKSHMSTQMHISGLNTATRFLLVSQTEEQVSYEEAAVQEE